MNNYELNTPYYQERCIYNNRQFDGAKVIDATNKILDAVQSVEKLTADEAATCISLIITSLNNKFSCRNYNQIY